MDFILQWIDVIWLPVAWFVVSKEQRLWALGTIMACMIMMRLLIELMGSIGFKGGIIGLLPLPVQGRGMAIYSVYYMLYLLLAHFSPHTRGIMFMGVSIAIFFMAAVTLAILMVF